MRRVFFRRPFRRAKITNQQQLAEAAYALPQNLREIHRLDFQHFVIRQELQGNYLAPLDHPKNILDVGCGTGRWAMELAIEFPTATVVGIDQFMPDPKASLGLGLKAQPDNATFMQGDVRKGLPFADASFDFVHIRLLFSAIPERVWPALLDEAIRVTKPEGWIESVESWITMSKSFPSGHTFTEWISEWLKQRELDPLIARKMPEMMRARGLEQIVNRELEYTPQAGMRWKHLYSAIISASVESLKTPILAQGIVTPEAYDQIAARMKQEAREGKGRLWPIYVTYGQRPAAPQTDQASGRINFARKYERLLARFDPDAGKTHTPDNT